MTSVDRNENNSLPLERLGARTCLDMADDIKILAVSWEKTARVQLWLVTIVVPLRVY